MADATTQGPHLLLYDGECGFCHWAVRFVLARDRKGLFHFAALQSAAAARVLAPFGGRPADLTTFYVLSNYKGRAPVLRSRSAAAFVVMGNRLTGQRAVNVSGLSSSREQGQGA